MSTLFNITEKYKYILQLAEEGADESVIKDTLESIEDEIEDKADGYAAVIKRLEANVEMIDKEKQRLDRIKKTHTNTIKRMKENLMDSMYATDKKKFRTELNHFYIKKNPVSLKVTDESLIPEDYFIVEKKLDSKTLKQYMQEHEVNEFSGARLTQSESVIIR